MSNVYTNELDAASGQSILIPSGYNLSLGGTILNSSSIPPDPEDEAGKYLVSNNTDAIFRHIGPTSISTFFNSGTWSRPDGINRVIVRVVGGGGGGSGHSESAGAGGYAEEVIDVRGISSVYCTVGNGSQSGTYYSGNGGGGGTSSFGNYLSASGGLGANQTYQHCGGLGGLGSGGNLNIYGGGGTGHMNYLGFGGGGFFGSGTLSAHGNWNQGARSNQLKAPRGAGGTSGYQGSYQGANGMAGAVIVMEFV